MQDNNQLANSNINLGDEVRGALTGQFFGYVIALLADGGIRVALDKVTAAGAQDIHGFSHLAISQPGADVLADIPPSPMRFKRCGECGCPEHGGANGQGHATNCSKYDHRLVASAPALTVPTGSKAARFIAYVNSLGQAPALVEVKPGALEGDISVRVDVNSTVPWDRSYVCVQFFINAPRSYRRASETIHAFRSDICGKIQKNLTHWERGYHAREIVAANLREQARQASLNQ